jgi:hypothetical protein
MHEGELPDAFLQVKSEVVGSPIFLMRLFAGVCIYNAYANIYMYMYIYMYVCVCMCMYVCMMCVCVCVCK